MTIENQLYKKLRHLVSTITSCNYIDYESKKDIVQDCMIILTSKIQDGSLANDFKKIEGYSFMVLRNYCCAWHNKESKRETPVAEFWEIKDDSELEADNLEYKEYLHTIAKNYIQQSKYHPEERIILDKLLQDYSDKEIVDSTSITSKQLGQYKFRIKVKLKYDVLRPVKYFIKSVNDKDLKVPCFTKTDVKNFFKDVPTRTVSHFIYSGFVTKNGYYVETLFKDNRGKKKKLS